MSHGKVKSRDAVIIGIIERPLRADFGRCGDAQITTHHRKGRIQDGDMRNVEFLAKVFQPLSFVRIDERIDDNAGLVLDHLKRPVHLRI